MRIALSQNMSYCFGVKRTLTLVEDLLEKDPDKTYYMLGEIVHNEYVINDLKSKGLKVIHDLEQVADDGIVIIQSHGAPKAIFNQLKKKNLDFIDATCPMVEVIHKKIRNLEEKGYFPVIIGKKGHDEVKGIAGQVKDALIVGKPEEVNHDNLGNRERVGVVVQSTFIKADALAVLEKIRSLIPETKFVNTICRPTTDRQSEVESIAGKYDYILIVGSKTSANTKHLYKLASGKKSYVYLIDRPETVRELSIPKNASVFIASGASTPLDLIERVVTFLNQKE